MYQLPKILDQELSKQNMWRIMERLFPMHRTLVGPGFTKSSEIIRTEFLADYGLNSIIHKFQSGTNSFDWIIPPGFSYKQAYIEDESGIRIIDVENDCYHIWNYSVPTDEILTLKELKKRISTLPDVPDAIPMRDSYYKRTWGFSATQKQVDSLKSGNYRVFIDSKLDDEDHLCITDCVLPGDSDQEILINTYLCHPKGANDNLSGVAVGIELIRLLSQIERRRYTYRLVIWPETIGSITYIANFPEQVKKTVGAIHLTCVGDNGEINYKQSYHGDSIVDRAITHALKYGQVKYNIRKYEPFGGDERQFNTRNVNVPCGTFMKTPPNEFPYYHTNKDNLEYVQPDYLFDSLNTLWNALCVLERNVVYKPNYITEPFLSGHGIFPYDQGMGSGERGGIYNRIVRTYYNIIPHLDGKTDLLSVATKSEEDITMFDRVVADMTRVGLIEES